MCELCVHLFAASLSDWLKPLKMKRVLNATGENHPIGKKKLVIWFRSEVVVNAASLLSHSHQWRCDMFITELVQGVTTHNRPHHVYCERWMKMLSKYFLVRNVCAVTVISLCLNNTHPPTHKNLLNSFPQGCVCVCGGGACSPESRRWLVPFCITVMQEAGQWVTWETCSLSKPHNHKWKRKEDSEWPNSHCWRGARGTHRHTHNLYFYTWSICRWESFFPSSLCPTAL